MINNLNVIALGHCNCRLSYDVDDYFYSIGPEPACVIQRDKNKAGHTATLVAWGWAGAVLEKVTRASGQEPNAQKAQKRQQSK